MLRPELSDSGLALGDNALHPNLSLEGAAASGQAEAKVGETRAEEQKLVVDEKAAQDLALLEKNVRSSSFDSTLSEGRVVGIPGASRSRAVARSRDRPSSRGAHVHSKGDRGRRGRFQP